MKIDGNDDVHEYVKVTDRDYSLIEKIDTRVAKQGHANQRD